MNGDKDKMVAAALGAIKHIFNPAGNERVLILTDNYKQNIADAFYEAFIQSGCSIDTYIIDNSTRPIKEIPVELETMLYDKKIVLNILRSFPEEISFRIKWIFKVKEKKVIRMGHMPGITEEMMLNSINVDFDKMNQTAQLLLHVLNSAEQLHITTKEGTDIILGIKDRAFISDIGVKDGEMCNIPCGEIYTAPLETEANGIVVVNASIADIGLLNKPLRIVVSKGMITRFESDDTELIKRITELTNVDQYAKVIGEFGIGLNQGARITGNMLEDEKALGTAHIAFGNNEDFPSGGKNKSKIHRDFLFHRPTINVIYKDGEGGLLIHDGIIVS